MRSLLILFTLLISTIPFAQTRTLLGRVTTAENGEALPGYKKLDFTLPDLEGNPVSLSDDKYKGKVVIVEIIGTCCPNCTDQTAFLPP